MLRILMFFIIILVSQNIFPQSASIYEEEREMTTYQYGDPDPVPEPGKIYPYFRFDSFALDPVQYNWNMVCMENDWIKLWVAPEIGGKVYGALDKNTGRYFIYHNNVVKFRDIAMRGPWTSGGIEINFGCIGHAPTTASPVDYYIRTNPDSSVSCFVGAIDLPSRTEWRTEIYLPPDKAWFETRSRWINPTSTGTSLYHWMNASADVSDDLRYYFPGNRMIDHSGNLYNWPVNEDGSDISYYMNNDFGADHSYHVLGKYTDWFGGYYADSDFGFAHWSPYPLKPGKKIWMWALSRQGEIWVDLLTDTIEGNGQYTEIQTGLLYNQAGSGSTYSPFKHLEFEPGSEISFSEKWFPVSNIQGLTHVSEDMALNFTRNDNGVLAMIYSTGQINDTLVFVLPDGENLFLPLDLMPGDTATIFIDGNKEITGVAYKGSQQLIYSIDQEDEYLDRPLEGGEFNWKSVYGLYYQALEYTRQREYDKARKYMQECLADDPDFVPAAVCLAELEMRRFRYDDAERIIREVLAFDTYNADANNIYGYLSERKGNILRALDSYGLASRSNKYHDYCLNKLVLLSLREKRTTDAGRYIEHADRMGINNSLFNRAKLAYARKTGNDSLFKQLFEKIIYDDPLNHFARFEKYLFEANDSLRTEFRTLIRNELPNQTYLEIACWYTNYEMYDEAYRLLKLSPANAIVYLHLAYVADKLEKKDESKHYLDSLSKSSTDFVFPYREETERIMKWAEGKTNSWTLRYYQALLYWNAGDRQKADQLFRASEPEQDNWVFYITRGDFTLPDDDILAEKDYREAFRLAPGEWRTNHRLINFYLEGGFTSRALELSQDAYEKFKGNYIIDFDHARCLLARDSVYRCIEVLEETVILPHEGARQGREVWKKANVLASIDSYWYGRIDEALAYIDNAYRWPENLGVGRPYSVDERLLDFVRAMIITKQGKRDEASNLYEDIIIQCNGEYDCIDNYNILKVFALRELNRNREADNYYSEWYEGLTDERVKAWALSLYEGRYNEAEEFAMTKPGMPDKDPWEEAVTVEDLSLLHRVVKKYLQERW